MIVGGSIETIPYSHSLGKAPSTRKIKARVFTKFKVTVSEVDHLDKWQRAALGFSLVGNDGKIIESLITQTFNFIDSLGLGQVCKEDRDVFYYE
jgi:uncharacterized protein YlxP (DUF503 family)